MAVKFVAALFASLLLSRHNVATAAALDRRLRKDDQFSMFAYGNGINGLPVFYDNGAAVIAEIEAASSTDSLVPVSFTATSGEFKVGFELSATPDTTIPVKNLATTSPPFQSATWFVPARGSLSHRVGFLTEQNAPTDDVVVKGFHLLERWVALEESDGNILMSLYCAFPTGTEGIWSLTWNETSTNKGGVPIVLKDAAPVPGFENTFMENVSCHVDV